MKKEFDADELIQWWLGKAAAEIQPMVDKIIEYGGAGRAVDLIEVGRELARLKDWEVNDAEAAELGIYFYIRGKMGRWQAAISEGRGVSDDTLHDIGIYIRMVQRIREMGGWPI